MRLILIESSCKFSIIRNHSCAINNNFIRLVEFLINNDLELCLAGEEVTYDVCTVVLMTFSPMVKLMTAGLLADEVRSNRLRSAIMVLY